MTARDEIFNTLVQLTVEKCRDTGYRCIIEARENETDIKIPSITRTSNDIVSLLLENEISVSSIIELSNIPDTNTRLSIIQFINYINSKHGPKMTVYLAEDSSKVTACRSVYNISNDENCKNEIVMALNDAINFSLNYIDYFEELIEGKDLYKVMKEFKLSINK